MHSQRNFVLAAEMFVERMYLQPDDRLFAVLPLFHMNALFYSLGGALAAGASLLLVPRFSASAFWRQAADGGATEVNILAAAGNILTRWPRSALGCRSRGSSGRRRCPRGVTVTRPGMPPSTPGGRRSARPSCPGSPPPTSTARAGSGPDCPTGPGRSSRRVGERAGDASPVFSSTVQPWATVAGEELSPFNETDSAIVPVTGADCRITDAVDSIFI
jgi:hypothetical protein